MQKTLLTLIFVLFAGLLFAQNEKNVNGKSNAIYEEARAKFLSKSLLHEEIAAHADLSIPEYVREFYKPNVTKTKIPNTVFKSRSEGTKQRLDSICIVSGDDTQKYEFEYDNNGILKKETATCIIGVGKIWEVYNIYERTYDNNENVIMSIRYDWNGTAWVESKKYTYTYNSNRKETTMVEYNRNGTAWVENLKTESTYNSNGNLTLKISYNWNGSAWKESGKYVYTYNSNGNQILYLYYFLNGTVWEERGKQEYEYDSNGNQTLWLVYNWNGTALVESFKYEHIYDNNGNLTMLIHYEWDGTALVENTKSEYTYDNNGNLTMQSFYYWIDAAWGKFIEDEFIYDSYGKEIIRYRYEWMGTVLQTQRKTESTYNSNGNLTLELGYYWTYWNPEWIEWEKTEYTYDSNGNQTMYIHYNWDIWKNEWKKSGKVESVFDLSYTLDDLLFPEWHYDYYFSMSNNKPIELSSYEWVGYGWVGNLWTDIWEETVSTKYYYSEVTLNISNPSAENPDIRVYPNPTSGIVYIDTAAAVQIYNPQGLLLQETFGNEVDLSAYPQGLYFLRIKGETVKIIKK